MKQNILQIKFLVLMLLFLSCCTSQTNSDEEYQPLGTAVLTANDILIAQFPHGPPEHFMGMNYVNLLKEDYQSIYERLKQYTVKIDRIDSNFKVTVYDENTLILTDWSCTQGYIDCWSYNGECDPDTLQVDCN